ncbi:uncharacterized protein ACO6RY_19805 [Pungitius sinensis]
MGRGYSLCMAGERL